MKVELVSYTPDALNLLLKTKNTRLTNLANPQDWTEEERLDHLAYMRDTIKSSWEFVDYTFLIEGVTRAFTHQLVRTRTGSYAQQAMRVVDASDQPVIIPETVEDNENALEAWCDEIANIKATYKNLIEMGVPLQDARGILPTHISTSIMAKFNLRTLHDMAKLRLCTRTQGEYQDVFRMMRQCVLLVHPWTDGFLEVHCVQEGTCAFPRYGNDECPVYDPRMDLTALKSQTKQRFWSIRHEAAPVAKNGKAM